MNKKYRCGRIMLTKDGLIKTIDLRHGGGIRSCVWRHAEITFKDVHDQLLYIYKLDEKNHETSLYDYEYQRINISEYKTFDEYLKRYGLYGNHTVVYLCTHQDDSIPSIEQEQISDDHQLHEHVNHSISDDDHHQINEKDSTLTDQSLPLTSMEKSSNKKNKKIFSMFRLLLKQFNGLINLIQLTRSSSFHQFILTSIDKLNSVKSNINLSDQSSTLENIDIISSIRNEFKKQFYELDINPAKSRSHLKLFESCKMALVTIRHSLASLQDIGP